MNRNLKKLAALLLSAACTLTTAGSLACVSAAEEHPEKHVTYLTLFTPQHSCYRNMEDVVKKYQEEVNPNFTVDFQYVPDRAAYLQKLKILISSNDVPDMWNIDTDPYAIQLLNEGYVQELTPTIEKYNLQDVFQEVPLAWGRTRDGAQLGIPNDFQIEVFWYNTELFEQAGVEPPKTWDEFMSVCATLKENGIVPIATSGVESPVLLRLPLLITYCYGGNDFLLDLARGKQKMNSEIGLKAAQFLADLGTNGYFQESFASDDYTTSRDYFLAGKSAMYFIGTGDFAKFVADDLSEDVKGKLTISRFRQQTKAKHRSAICPLFQIPLPRSVFPHSPLTKRWNPLLISMPTTLGKRVKAGPSRLLQTEKRRSITNWQTKS